jgi:hypothetical protein
MGEIRKRLASDMHSAIEPEIKTLAFEMDRNYWTLVKQLNPEANYPTSLDVFVKMYRKSNDGLLRSLKLFVHLCDPNLEVINIQDRNDTNGEIIDEVLELGEINGKLDALSKVILEQGRGPKENQQIRDIALDMQNVLDRLLGETVDNEDKSIPNRKTRHLPGG